MGLFRCPIMLLLLADEGFMDFGHPVAQTIGKMSNIIIRDNVKILNVTEFLIRPLFTCKVAPNYKDKMS